MNNNNQMLIDRIKGMAPSHDLSEGVSNPNLIDKTFALEEAIKQFPKIDLATYKEGDVGGQIEIPVKHYFSFGVYAREITIPPGACFTGEIHKYQNLNILSKGRISVSIDDEIKEIEAPYTFVAPSGSKRIFYAHTECVWTTIHGTELKDVNEIEKVFTAKSKQEFLDFIGANQLQLGFKE